MAEDYAYVAAAEAGLRVINVADPAAPVEAGFYDTPGYAQGVAVVGKLVYVADGSSGLRVVNLANPAAPVEVGFYDTLGEARRVAVAEELCLRRRWRWWAEHPAFHWRRPACLLAADHALTGITRR